MKPKDIIRSFLQRRYADPIEAVIKEMQAEYRELGNRVRPTTDETALNTAKHAGKAEALDDLMERLSSIASEQDE